MGSKRFPGKMMRLLGGFPIIRWVLARTKESRLLERILLATTDLPEDDCLAEAAAAQGIPAFRGSAEDVLKRFVDASCQQETTVVVRICADNPFVSASEIDRIIQFYLDTRPDYAFNHIPRMGNGYPDGLGAEVLSRQLLQRIGSVASGEEREHVTLYLWNHVDRFVIKTVPCPVDLCGPSIGLDVDTPEDLALLERLCAEGISITSPPAEIVAKARSFLS
jgi:spore coat polysaccharide biosynthesis protein SpsF